MKDISLKAHLKWTKAQLAELECISWFIPDILRNVEITDEDKKNYFAYSERGIKTETLHDKTRNQYDGLDALKEGKRWRGIHCDTSRDKATGKVINRAMYEEGVLEGTMPYFAILEGSDMPRVVVDYMKKSLFGGMDAELIEKVYNELHEK